MVDLVRAEVVKLWLNVWTLDLKADVPELKCHSDPQLDFSGWSLNQFLCCISQPALYILLPRSECVLKMLSFSNVFSLGNNEMFGKRDY